MIVRSRSWAAGALLTILTMGCMHRPASTATPPPFTEATRVQALQNRLAVLQEFLKERPSASSWNQLGLVYDELGDLRSGENALREAIALDAQSDAVHNNLGYNLLLQNKSEAAEAEFRKALELNSNSATARNNLGVVLARRGDFEGALEQFQITGDAAAAHNNLAVVLFESGQYEQSREQLIKALAIRPGFAPALANFKLVQELLNKKTPEVRR